MHCMKKVTDLIIEPRRTYQSSYRIQLFLHATHRVKNT
jgi:hypothetical protein